MQIRHMFLTMMDITEVGARWGLIGKTGAIPARSRHCNEEQTHFIPLRLNLGKVWASYDSEPGELPI